MSNQASSYRKSKRPLLWAMLGLLILAAMALPIGLAVWKYGQNGGLAGEARSAPEGNNHSEVNQSISGSEIDNVSSVPEGAAPTREIAYYLKVQKMRNGKPFEEPFHSSGQEIFEGGYKFRMAFQVDADGYVYLFNEDRDAAGNLIYNILYPTPKTNNGSAEIKSNQQLETGNNTFGGQRGTEVIWLIWIAEKQEDPESAKAVAFRNRGVVNDEASVLGLKKFLEKHNTGKTETQKDSANQRTVVKGKGDVSVTSSQQMTDGVAFAPTTYTYNLSGALVEQTYPSGRIVKNVLDNDGQLSIVQSRKNQNYGFWNYAQHFTYTAAGAMSSMQLGSGRWESTVFNSRLQPEQIALGNVQNATNLLKLDYTYSTPNSADNNGNVLTQTITVPGAGQTPGFTAVQQYQYDSLNRLKQAEEIIANQTSWKQRFDYDRYGNRNFDEANTTTLPKGCNNNTEVCADDRKVFNPGFDTPYNRLSTSEGYTFDNAGNTTEDAQNRRFTYDGENKQVKVEALDSNGNVTGTIGEYFYDGDGKRVKKYVPSTGETTIFIYDASGKLVAEYSTIVAAQQDAKVGYLTSDHLGSPRINTDQNGAVTARHDYHPFGEEIARTSYGADDVRQKFTSYERDDESDLDYAKNRYHNFNLGRFTSPDPYKIVAEIKFEKTKEEAERKLKMYIAEPQKWNQYSYTINNPLRYTDPTGEEIWLRGTAEEIAEAEALLKEILGDERYKYIKRFDHNGDDGYARVLNIDAKDVEAFSKIGDDIHNKALSEGMAHILSDRQVLEVRVDGNFVNMQGKLVDVDRVNPENAPTDAGYIPYSYNINKHAQAVIGPGTVDKANNILKDRPDLSTDGIPLRMTKAVALAHEIGHHWKRRDGTDGSIAFENAVRSRSSQRLRKAEN